MGFFDFIKCPNPLVVVSEMADVCNSEHIRSSITDKICRWVPCVEKSAKCEKVLPYVIAAGLANMKLEVSSSTSSRSKVLNDAYPDVIRMTLTQLEPKIKNIRSLFNLALKFAANVSHMMPPNIDVRLRRSGQPSEELTRLSEASTEWLCQMCCKGVDSGVYESESSHQTWDTSIWGDDYWHTLVDLTGCLDDVLKKHYTSDFNWGY